MSRAEIIELFVTFVRLRPDAAASDPTFLKFFEGIVALFDEGHHDAGGIT